MKCFLLNFEESQQCDHLLFIDSKILFIGGMTEEKKTSRRNALAMWLKESIMRLGPTFIKVGQQFSTRVDILPQEYVDQLSELQVELEYWVELIRLFPCIMCIYTHTYTYIYIYIFIYLFIDFFVYGIYIFTWSLESL